MYTPSAVVMSERRYRQRMWMRRQPLFDRTSTAAWFVLGAESSANATAEAEAEQGEHGDVLLFDCRDTDVFPFYSATAEKVLLSLRHAVLSYRFDYFIRGADDAVVLLANLAALLSAYGARPRLYAGLQRKKEPVGVALRRVWSGRMLPRHVSGLGYVLSSDLAALVARATEDSWSCLHVGWPEDACSGQWVHALFPSYSGDKRHFTDYHYSKWRPETVAIVHKLPVAVWDSVTRCGKLEPCRRPPGAPPGIFLKAAREKQQQLEPAERARRL
eukprot:TRINITY_DN11062_c1_g1_i1.p1 TRINITY_DN11062_c1_g1~~TRINITY_DN11062_c1_g1_i1.p1  ORF type:complete len:273 (+),score=97.55 TRINITY_DN11062_c1_g1_i1:710-1528(+)